MLARDVVLDDYRLDVSARRGHVALAGMVGSEAERDRARARAWTAGVESVDVSEVGIDAGIRDPALRESDVQSRNPTQIHDAIVDAASGDPRFGAADVTLIVDGPAVTLVGVVDDPEIKRAAEEIARNTAGVASVINDIEVVPTEQLRDGRGEMVSLAETPRRAPGERDLCAFGR
jgi:osmotically-inducible protein OsmY